MEIKNNFFVSPEETDSPNYGIIFENPKDGSLVAEDNIFIGKIDKEVITGTGE